MFNKREILRLKRKETQKSGTKNFAGVVVVVSL